MTGLVAQSLTGALWQAEPYAVSPEVALRHAGLFAQQYDMPDTLSLLLAQRGITPEISDFFLNPKLRDLLPNPSDFQDMDKACALLADAIITKTPIGIFGDYDVDGACATALFLRFFEAFQVPATCHIPDRFAEGYGPNETALNGLKAKGAELIITVDCGITAHAPLDAVAEAGMDVIVIDHHKAGTTLPRAKAVVNPNRLDDTSGQGALCAAGMVFMCCVGTMRHLREHHAMTTPPIDLLSLLDLVGFATICDIVPLTLTNRAFVKQGLAILKERKNTGLRVLADISGVNKPPTAQTFGFVLGPRINAGGRLGQSSIGAELLSTHNEARAIQLASELQELNKERRQIEADVQQLADDAAFAQISEDNSPVIIVAGQGWHEGVIGIVAGRLKEKYHRPAIVISLSEEGVGKGSARGIAGFRLGDAILAAKEAGILLGGGGHDMAAGLSLSEHKLPDFMRFMTDRFAAEVGVLPPPRREVAGELTLSACTSDFVNWIETLAPFGSDFPEPRFMLRHCFIKRPRWLGEAKDHFSCEITDGTGVSCRAIAFRIRDKLENPSTLEQDGQFFNLLGRLVKDDYRGGNAVQFQIDDIAIAAPTSTV